MVDRIVNKPTTGPGKKILNSNVTDANAASTLATLQARQKAGNIGPNDLARLKNLQAKYPNGAPAGPTGGSEIDTTIDPNTGKIKDPNEVINGLQKTDTTTGMNNAYNAAYGYLTKDYAAQKIQDTENAKQELADRGIPVSSVVGNSNSPDVYQRTLGNIDTKYQSLDDQAKSQAMTAAQGFQTTQSNADKNANDSYLQAELGMSDEDYKVFQTTDDYKTKMAALAQQAAIKASDNATALKIAGMNSAGTAGGLT